MRRAMLTLLALPLCIVSAGSPAFATEWTISPDGTGDFPSIQAAIDGSTDGDVIVLESGTFTGSGNSDVNFHGKAVTVRSASGDPSTCTIDCYWMNDNGCTQHRGFLFLSGEDAGSVLEGVRIVNGESYVSCIGCEPWPQTMTGGSIYIEDSSPTISDVEIRHSSAFIAGGAMDIRSGSPMITGCVLEANSVYWSHPGGALRIDLPGSPVFEDCVFAGNESGYGGAIYVSGGATPTFRRCVITGNSALGGPGGGGIAVVSAGTMVTIEESTIASNRTDGGGGGVLVGDGLTTLDRAILHGNCAGEDLGDDAWIGSSGQLDAGCSVLSQAAIRGPGVFVPAGDNVFAAPLLCSPLPCLDAPSTFGIFTLSEGSPALDAPGCGLIGGLGQGCGVGVSAASWGSIKAMYR